MVFCGNPSSKSDFEKTPRLKGPFEKLKGSKIPSSNTSPLKQAMGRGGTEVHRDSIIGPAGAQMLKLQMD